jgi:hypothetical protein
LLAFRLGETHAGFRTEKARIRVSFSVDLTRNGTTVPDANVDRQDFSMQNTKTLPINDATAFVALFKVLSASNPAAALWSLPFKDKFKSA